MSIFKKIIIFVVIIFLVFSFVFLLKDRKPEDLSVASDSRIITLLKKNEDNNNYINNHADYIIKERSILTQQAIIDGQNGQNFKEVYQGLEMEDNRYLKVDLINPAGDRWMITVLDMKTGEVLKAYGTILVTSGG